jgi:hypothetical protein
MSLVVCIKLGAKTEKEFLLDRIRVVFSDRPYIIMPHMGGGVYGACAMDTKVMPQGGAMAIVLL